MLAGAAFCVTHAACGSSDESTFDGGLNGDPDVSVGPGFDNDGSAGDGGARACVNLECKQVKCDDGGTTTISGKVYDPAGINPLYNALVYIPNAPLAAFDDDAGVTCDRCNGALASGAPLVSAITKPDGTFVLENVPVGVDLPLVMQIGKWRRQVMLPAANKCTDNPVTDVGLTRMPKNSQEGHLPHFAIATGGADPFECLLRKIGIDDAEFTLPSDKGRIHYFESFGGIDFGDAGSGGTPHGSTLWSNPAPLSKYDVVLLPCEASPNDADKGDNAQTAQGKQNIENYVNIGGRLFVTHYSYTWLETAPPPFPTVATWEHKEGDRSDKDGANPTFNAKIDDSFPKGAAFKSWLVNVGASTTPGVLPIIDWRHDMAKENAPPSQRWIYGDTHTAWTDQAKADAGGAGNVVQHITFNAPLDAGVDDAGESQACGKVVFSDFHVSATARQAGTFPTECKNDPMTPQEKALEFMLFDLSACIQKEDAPPTPPGTVPH